MTNEEPESNSPTPESKSFSEQTNPLLAGLFYPGESDEPVEPVTCYLDQAEPLSGTQLKDWLMLPPSVYVEEVPEITFWEPVTTEQDWHDEEEKARTTRFRQLKKLFDDTLTGRQVFFAGDTEIDVYLLGRQTDGSRTGLKTKIVQT